MNKNSDSDEDRVRLQKLIAACVVDGINRYMNQVLIPDGLLDQTKLRSVGSGINGNLHKKKHEIAQSIASRLMQE